MNNPYDAPGADLSQPLGDSAGYPAAFFALRGRIGRVRYVAYFMGILILMSLGQAGIVALLAMTVGRNSVLMTFIPLMTSAFMFIAFFLVARRRLNDMNWTGWVSLVILVPIVNLGLILWLLFGPGSKGANKYGAPPCENSKGVIAACVAAVAMFILVIGFSAVSAYFTYKVAGAAIFKVPRASTEQAPR